MSSIYILCGNDLRSGDVVYWTGNCWSGSIADGTHFSDIASAQAQGDAQVLARAVIESYPVEVTLTDRGPVPTRYRELIKARGPSVRADLGKQTEL